MKVNKAEIVISAVNSKQYPEHNLPEIVLLGRSNVGKSSFINTLINRKALARTSSQPGKTRTINFYSIEDSFFFVDMPGYGYAKVSKKEREKFGKMMEEYLLNRINLKMIIQLIDFRHTPNENDVLMYNWLVYNNLIPLVVANKTDKVKRSQHKKHREDIIKTLNIEDPRDLVLFSSVTKHGKEDVWKIIEAINH